MKNLHPHHLTPYLLSAGLLCSPAVFAQETFSSLFTDAKPILDVRYRYEHVDQDNALEHATPRRCAPASAFRPASGTACRLWSRQTT